MFPFPFALFSKAGTLSQIYKFRVGRERVFFGSFLTLFVDQREAVVRERKLARQKRRDAAGRNRDIAIAEKLKHGRDKIVRVAVDRRVIPDKAVGIGRGHLNSSSHLGM